MKAQKKPETVAVKKIASHSSDTDLRKKVLISNEVEDIIIVPKDRIGAIIGEKGKTKREIETLTCTKIDVNSDTGEVKIKRGTSENLETAIAAQHIMGAIAIGFTPKKAFKLLSSDVYTETIDLEEHIKSSQIARVKARIIGTEGKSRNYISKLSETDIVIYKNKVSILGAAEDVDAASTVIMMLIEGASHRTVFKFLEKRRIK